MPVEGRRAGRRAAVAGGLLVSVDNPNRFLIARSLAPELV